jgi:hypothetical protein
MSQLVTRALDELNADVQRLSLAHHLRLEAAQAEVIAGNMREADQIVRVAMMEYTRELFAAQRKCEVSLFEASRNVERK